jgi:hypothetical protein
LCVAGEGAAGVAEADVAGSVRVQLEIAGVVGKQLDGAAVVLGLKSSVG